MTDYIRRTLLPILDSLAAEESNENQRPTANDGPNRIDDTFGLGGISDSLAKLNLYNSGVAKINAVKNGRRLARYKKQINSPLAASNVTNIECDNSDQPIRRKKTASPKQRSSNIRSNWRSLYEGSVLMNLGDPEPPKPLRKKRTSAAVDSLQFVGNSTTEDSAQQSKNVVGVLDSYVLQPSANFCNGVRKYGGILGIMMDGRQSQVKEGGNVAGTRENRRVTRKLQSSPTVRGQRRKRVTVQSVLAFSPPLMPLKRRDQKKTPMKLDDSLALLESQQQLSPHEKQSFVEVAGSDDTTKSTLQSASCSTDENIPTLLSKLGEGGKINGCEEFTDYNPMRPTELMPKFLVQAERKNECTVNQLPIIDSIDGTGNKDSVAHKGRLLNIHHKGGEESDSSNSQGGVQNFLEICHDVETVSLTVDCDDANIALLGHDREIPKEDYRRHHTTPTSNAQKLDVIPVKYVRLTDDGAEVSPLAGGDGNTAAGRFYETCGNEGNDFLESLEASASTMLRSSSEDNDQENVADSLLNHTSVQRKNELLKSIAPQVHAVRKSKVQSVKYNQLDDPVEGGDQQETLCVIPCDVERKGHRTPITKSIALHNRIGSVDQRNKLNPHNGTIASSVCVDFGHVDDKIRECGKDADFEEGGVSTSLLGCIARKTRTEMSARLSLPPTTQKSKVQTTPITYVNLANDDEMESSFNDVSVGSDLPVLPEMSPMSCNMHPQSVKCQISEGKPLANVAGEAFLGYQQARDMVANGHFSDGFDSSTINSDAASSLGVDDLAPMRADAESSKHADEISSKSTSPSDDPQSKLMSVKVMRIADSGRMSQLIVERDCVECNESVKKTATGYQAPSNSQASWMAADDVDRHGQDEIKTPKCASPKSKVMSLEYARPFLPPFGFKENKGITQKLSELLDSVEGDGEIPECVPVHEATVSSKCKRSGDKQLPLPDVTKTQSCNSVSVAYCRLVDCQKEETSQLQSTFDVETSSQASLEQHKRPTGPKKKYRRVNRGTAKAQKPSKNGIRTSGRRPQPPNRFVFEPLPDATNRKRSLRATGTSDAVRGTCPDAIKLGWSTRIQHSDKPPTEVHCESHNLECSNESNEVIPEATEVPNKIIPEATEVLALRRSARTRTQTDRFGNFCDHEAVDKVVTSPYVPELPGSSWPKPDSLKGSSSRYDSMENFDVSVSNENFTESVRDIPTGPRPTNPTISAILDQADVETEVTLPQWTDEEIDALQVAVNCANPRSSTFWQDVAAYVDSKSAFECQDKWFSMVKTPAVKVKKNKRVSRNAEVEYLLGGDDIFNSTPMRGLLADGLDLNTPLIRLANFDADARRLSTSPSHTMHNNSSFGTFSKRNGYKTYLQTLKRDLNRATKVAEKCKNKQPDKKSSFPRNMHESIDDGEIDINCRLTPGGTVRFSGHRELEEEEEIYFVDDDYEEENSVTNST